MKSTCGGTRLEINIEKHEKFLIQNLTSCKSFCSKSEKTKKFCFKI